MRRRLVRFPRSALFLLLLPALVACSPVEGALVPTGAMRVDVEVLAFAFPRPTEVLVAFETGSPSRRVELEPGATVEAIPAFGAPVVLSEGAGPGLIDGVAYVGELGDVASGDVLGFDLLRPVEVDALGSAFVVPPAPMVLGPASGGTYGNGATITVAWSGGLGDDVWVRTVPVACDGVDQEELDVRALLSYPPVVLMNTGSVDVELEFPEVVAASTCTFEILVGFVRQELDLAPEFAGGGEVAIVSIATPIEVEVVVGTF
ncbi:MAG: hypothetical protein ABR510_03590 [Trueperaceae bacterium]